MKTLIKKIIHKGWPVVFLLAILTLSTVASCKDDDGGNNLPVIHYLRLTDPVLADSTFTDVEPGTMLAVIGENLDGVIEVYINNQKISFNSTYSTPTSLIITVPYDEDFKLTSTNPELQAELRIVTNHGTATFPMHVLSPGPNIFFVSAFYPIESGDEVTLMGQNFYEIKRIYFSKDSVEVTMPITDYQVSNDYEQITFNMPDKLKEGGYIFVDCYTDEASIEFVPTGPKPAITGISSTMPMPGTEVTIVGKNFINVSNVNINGEFDIPKEDLEISEAMNAITFTMPEAPEHSGNIRVTAIGGTAELEGFYPREHIVLDFDDRGSRSWGDNSDTWTTDGTTDPFIADRNYSGIKGTISANNSWWGQIVTTTFWPGNDIISDDTPISELELQFECYVTKLFDGPVLEIQIGGNFDASLKDYVPVSSFTGKTETAEWMQCSIPLESLVAEATWKEFTSRVNENPQDANTQLGIYVRNPSNKNDVSVEFYVDNFRIVPNPKRKLIFKQSKYENENNIPFSAPYDNGSWTALL